MIFSFVTCGAIIFDLSVPRDIIQPTYKLSPNDLVLENNQYILFTNKTQNTRGSVRLLSKNETNYASDTEYTNT